MRKIVTKYYLGAWHNIYKIDWPIRFLFELAFLIVVMFLIIKIIGFVAEKSKAKPFFIKLWYWIVTEIAYLVGRNSRWVIAVEDKMINGATEKVNGNRKKKGHPVLKAGICIVIILIYFLAVFVDLPVSKHLTAYYLNEMKDVKAFFQKFETVLSKGYEKYPPLFDVDEQETEDIEDTEDEELQELPEEKQPIYIQLNEKGSGGSRIRSEADLSSDDNVIDTVNEESDILYENEWIFDGERYWVRVYIEDTDVEGWLSGNLVDDTQLNDIIDENIR